MRDIEELTAFWEKRIKELHFGDIKPKKECIHGAMSLLATFIVGDIAMPQDIYVMPDGNIVLENQCLNDIARIEIEDATTATFMLTHQDRPAVFRKLKRKNIGWTDE